MLAGTAWCTSRPLSGPSTNSERSGSISGRTITPAASCAANDLRHPPRRPAMSTSTSRPVIGRFSTRNVPFAHADPSGRRKFPATASRCWRSASAKTSPMSSPAIWVNFGPWECTSPPEPASTLFRCIHRQAANVLYGTFAFEGFARTLRPDLRLALGIAWRVNKRNFLESGAL